MGKKLSKLIMPERDIQIAEGVEFSVRGISLNDIGILMHTHLGELTEAFNFIRDRGTGVTDTEVKNLIGDFIPKFPGLVTQILCIANDDVSDEAVATSSRLPIAKQIEALQAIFELSLTSEAEVKKLMESVTKMIQSVAATLAQARLPNSEAGSGAFVDK